MVRFWRVVEPCSGAVCAAAVGGAVVSGMMRWSTRFSGAQGQSADQRRGGAPERFSLGAERLPSQPALPMRRVPLFGYRLRHIGENRPAVDTIPAPIRKR